MKREMMELDVPQASTNNNMLANPISNNNNSNPIRSENSNPNIIDAEMQHVQNKINEMKLQYYEQIQPMKDDLSYAINKCQQIHTANMVKIPRNVKTMKIEEFDSLYHCDLLSLLQSIRTNNGGNNGDDVMMTTTKSLSLAMETTTPSIGRQKKNLQTPSKTIRKGRETTKGDLVATVTKKRNPRGVFTSAAGSSSHTEMGISVGDGMIVPLNDEECIKELDHETKSNALDQVYVLQQQLAKIVTLLQK